MNRTDKISQMFYVSRDEKREQLVGKGGDTRAIGKFKSVPARKKFKKGDK